MKKKTRIIIIIVLAVIIALLLSYKLIGGAIMKSKTRDYLETKGCFAKHIHSIKVKHSFFNKLLSYDEWYIVANLYGSHEFTFTYRDKEIVLTGIVEDNKTLPSKEHYEDLMKKFESGELCNPMEVSEVIEAIDIAYNYLPDQYKERITDKYTAQVHFDYLKYNDSILLADPAGNSKTIETGNIILIIFGMDGMGTADTSFPIVIDGVTHELIGFPFRI